MIPACCLREVRRQLGEAFDQRYASAAEPQCRMVGVLFAPSGSSLTKTEILPRMDDFHHRSASNIDFFCAGYGAFWPQGFAQDEESVGKTTDSNGHQTHWKYSSKLFNDLLNDVKHEAVNWNYSGEVDLLLLNAYRGPDRKVHLDFSGCVALAISRLKNDGAITSAPELFEQIFSYAESASGLPLTYEFSDRMGLSVSRSWLTKLVTSYLPLKSGTLWQEGRHFAITDLTEPGQIKPRRQEKIATAKDSPEHY